MMFIKPGPGLFASLDNAIYLILYLIRTTATRVPDTLQGQDFKMKFQQLNRHGLYQITRSTYIN